MTEEYDIQALAKKAEETRKANPKKRLLLKVLISSMVALVFVVGGGLLAYSFFERTDFSGDIPLSKTVSQWDPLFLYYGETKGEIINHYGTWIDKDNTGQFYNESNDCFIKLIPMGAPSNKEGSDLEDTNSLIAGLGDSTLLGGSWVPMQDDPGRVEFKTILFSSTEGGKQQLGGFFRSFGKSGSNLAVTLGCEDNTELLKEIMDDQLKEFNLGITLTTENRLMR